MAAAPAAGEDFFDLTPEDLSRLRVTAASAFTESPLDASASVSVVRREEWERRGARTGPDAVLHLPGVMVLYPPAGGPLIQVRSYDSTSLRGRATLVDGVPINTFAFGSEVFSNAEFRLPVLDSLELVRGPSSILYGSDAFHSALVLSTYADPVPSLTLNGTVAADYHELAARGTWLPSDGHTVQMAVAAARQGDQDTDYVYQPVGGGRAEASRDQRYEAATAMVRWSGRSQALGYSLQLLVDKTEADDFPGGGTISGNSRGYDSADRNAELWLLKGALNGSLGGGWSWSWDAYGWRNDYGQSYVLPTTPAAELFFEDRQQFLEYRYGSRVELKHSGLRLGATSTQLALTGGIERAEIEDHDNHRIALLPSTLLAAPPADYNGLDQSIRSLAVEAKTRWGDSPWQLLYGGRLDDYSTFGNEWSPRLGVIWMPASHYSVRAVYGTAFRAPNANELRGTNFAGGNTLLGPEQMKSVELAFTWARASWQWEVVGFANRWEDRILLRPDPSAIRGLSYTNFGESEAHGVESALSWRNDRWRVELSGTLLRNENHETGEEPGLFPEWIASVGVGYRWPAERLELFIANRLHQNVATGDKALPVSLAPLHDAGTFFRTDVSLTQEWGKHWQGRLLVRNLFDRDNVWPSITNSHGGIEDIERQFVVEVSWRGLR